jgi:hypothetical protein
MCGSALLVIAPITLTACPGGTGPNPAPIQVAGTYDQPPSGLRFPDRAGEFRRVEINR